MVTKTHKAKYARRRLLILEASSTTLMYFGNYFEPAT